MTRIVKTGSCDPRARMCMTIQAEQERDRAQHFQGWWRLCDGRGGGREPMANLRRISEFMSSKSDVGFGTHRRIKTEILRPTRQNKQQNVRYEGSQNSNNSSKGGHEATVGSNRTIQRGGANLALHSNIVQGCDDPMRDCDLGLKSKPRYGSALRPDRTPEHGSSNNNSDSKQ